MVPWIHKSQHCKSKKKYVGRFWLLGCHRVLRFSLKQSLVAVSEKAHGSKINVPKMDRRSFRWCPWIIRDALEWFRMLMDQNFWFSETLIFCLEMTSPYDKWPLKMRFRCAGAQCFHVVMLLLLSEHGAKHFPPARGPFGGSNGNLAEYFQNDAKMTPS